MNLRTRGGSLAVGSIFFAVTGFAACSGSDGPRGAAGSTAIVNTIPEPAGVHCPAGGIKVVAGLDTNADGVLSPDEISDTQYVCNGASGDAGPPGANGSDGDAGPKGDPGDAGPPGTPGDAGPPGATGDAGPRGATGDAGSPGPKGDQGAQGDAGPAGLTALVTITTEPPGPNCEFGGIRVESGLDTDENGQLSAAEAGPPQYVCNGAPGSSSGAAGASSSSGGTGAGGAATAGSGGASGNADAGPDASAGTTSI